MKKYGLFLLLVFVFSVCSIAIFAQNDDNKITSLADADQGGFLSGFKKLFTRFMVFLKDEEYQPGAEKKEFVDEKRASTEKPKSSRTGSAPLASSRGRQTAQATVPAAVDSSYYTYDDTYDEENYDEAFSEDYAYDDVSYEESSYEDTSYEDGYYAEEYNEGDADEQDGALESDEVFVEDVEELPADIIGQPKQQSRGRRAPAALADTQNVAQPMQQKRGFFGRLAQLVKGDDAESEDALLEQRERCKELYDSGDKKAFMKECKQFIEQMREGFADVMPAVDPERLEECKEIAASGDREAFKMKCPELFDRFAVFNNEEGRGIPEHAQFCKRLMDNGQYDRFKQECPEFVDKLEAAEQEKEPISPDSRRVQRQQQPVRETMSPPPSPEMIFCKELYDKKDFDAFKEKCPQFAERMRKEGVKQPGAGEQRLSAEDEK